jgi:SPP1 gp7 family putative phage head morphogenesis protein
MAKSVTHWVRAGYRANTPEIAQDESPAEALRRLLGILKRRWFKRFDKAAQDLATYFSTAVSKRSDATLKSILKKGGFAIEWKMTRAQNDIIRASIAENVSLIKSIPQQYLTNVEGMVMRAVQVGGDVGGLVKDLQREYGITRRRAVIIARDQNSKANANLTRARQIEIGVTEAIWLHSHAGRKPRPTHVAMDGKRYNVVEGMYDPAEGKHIFPGQLVNCRCLSRSVTRMYKATRVN